MCTQMHIQTYLVPWSPLARCIWEGLWQKVDFTDARKRLGGGTAQGPSTHDAHRGSQVQSPALPFNDIMWRRTWKDPSLLEAWRAATSQNRQHRKAQTNGPSPSKQLQRLVHPSTSSRGRWFERRSQHYLSWRACATECHTFPIHHSPLPASMRLCFIP